MIELKNIPNFKQMDYAIDGASICYSQINETGKPMLMNLILVREYMLSQGINEEKIIIFCDASLRHYIDEIQEYRDLIKVGEIHEVPAGIKADKFILNYCLNHSTCYFISNDLMREYYIYLPSERWIVERRISVMIINKRIMLIPMSDSPKSYKKYRKEDISTINITPDTTMKVLERIENSLGKFDLY